MIPSAVASKQSPPGKLAVKAPPKSVAKKPRAAAKTIAKKPSTAGKKAAKKVVAKPPVTKKVVAKPAVSKKPSAAGKKAAKKVVAKPPVTKKVVAKPAVSKKPSAAGKKVTKKVVAKPAVAKKVVAKPPVAKPPVAKKAVAKKPVASPATASKSPARKAAAQPAAAQESAVTVARAARSTLAQKRAIESTLGQAPLGKEVVDAYMRDVDHPFKAEMEAVRQIILGAGSQLGERIKWNAPSFFYKDDFAAFNPRTSEFVHLIVLFPGGVGMDEHGDLLEGKHKDRREAKFHSMDDVNAKKPALERLVRRWLELRAD